MTRLGGLKGTALSAALVGSRWALIAYPRELLGKSGVSAACAAHGCAVLNIDPAGADREGLRRREHEYALAEEPDHTPAVAPHPSRTAALSNEPGKVVPTVQAQLLAASLRAL